MRTYWLLISLIGLTLTVMAPLRAEGQTPSVNYQVRWIAKTRVHIVWINLNDSSLMVQPVLAWNTVGRRQSFASFLAVYQPLAQITGSYFSLDTSQPIGDVMIGGRLRWRGPAGTALALTADNRAEMVNIPYGWTYSWPGYEHVIQGGVRLVQNGKYAVYPRDQGFRDPALFRPATRTAVGIDRRNRLLLVAVGRPIYLSRLAAIMKALDCRDAMALDGGTSTGLAYGLHVIFTPGRSLSSVLMVLPRPPKLVPPITSILNTDLAPPDCATTVNSDPVPEPGVQSLLPLPRLSAGKDASAGITMMVARAWFPK